MRKPQERPIAMITALDELKLWMFSVIIWLLLGLTWAHAQVQPGPNIGPGGPEGLRRRRCGEIFCY
jgi:hypothetical protein